MFDVVADKDCHPSFIPEQISYLWTHREIEELWFVVCERRCSSEVDVFQISTFDHKMAGVRHLSSKMFRLAQSSKKMKAVCVCVRERERMRER